MTGPVHLHPTAELAERVILPGDPGRAMRLAQELLSQPRMFNHHRGLWGYTGIAQDGDPLSVQSTGMGGPSAAIVIEELIGLGARRLVRLGTCGALTDRLGFGELALVTDCLAADGTSRALGAGELTRPAGELLDRLRVAGQGRTTPVRAVSTDLFYDRRATPERDWVAAGASVVEMECSTLFELAQSRGAMAAALLIVTDLLIPARRRIEPGDLQVAETRAGHLVAAALKVLP